ncbi:MAG: chemotaxis-specific protein-glutamate methyltransferase CheB [Novosphingobium sp.]|nr:chemotaxis-specific protein-glutamate methyltransferase CheB [Novosphingobium sp.]
MNAVTSLNSSSNPPGAPVGGMVRVFVVDDSSMIRAVYTRIIAQDPGLELAGTAISAEDALAQLGGLHVQVVLLDLEMPGMGGMRALPEIIKRTGGAKVMVVSTLAGDGAEHTVQALSLGAADTLQKPAPGQFDDEYRTLMIQKIKALGKRPLRRAASSEAPPAPVIVQRAPSQFRARIVAIGASTGGIYALSVLLGALPPKIGAPILVTQHLPVEFLDAFARQLRECSGRQAVLAEDGMDLVPDNIMVAPGNAHLCLERKGAGNVVRLDRNPAASGCMPSVDPMFESLARHYGGHALGVVLTGMGRDGTVGARALVEAGAGVIVQNEASSVVWGMPGSVAKAGLASAMLHPLDLAARIAVCTEPS